VQSGAPLFSRIRRAVIGASRPASRFTAALLLAAPVGIAHAQQKAAPPTFDIEEYRVEGNTLLPTREIEAAVYDFLGPGRTVADVERARAALEALYNRHGYPTVSAEIPRQSAAEGVIVINVVERPVGRLRVVGARYFSPEAIRQQAPSLAEGTVPNSNAVQRDLAALNQQPERSITPVLRAGRAPDTVDVDLQVHDQLPLRGSLEIDNRSSASTRPLRLTGSLSYDNLWQRGDSASFFFQVAPQHLPDASVWSGSYLWRIPGSAFSLLGSYLKSNSDVSTVGATTVIGKGKIAGLRLVMPLTQEAGFSQSVNAGFDYKSFGQSISSSGAIDRVPLTYFPLSATYQASWSTADAETDLTASAVGGTTYFGSSGASFDQNRFNAPANFFYVRAAASRQQELPYGTQGWMHVQVQGAPQPLVPNEEFGLGGLDTVRGYQEAEILGDNAVDAQFELRSPSIAGRIGPRVNELRLHLFTDVGQASIQMPLPEQKRTYTLESVGAGLRMRMFDRLNGALEDAVPLQNGTTTRAGANRVLFRVYGDF